MAGSAGGAVERGFARGAGRANGDWQTGLYVRDAGRDGSGGLGVAARGEGAAHEGWGRRIRHSARRVRLDGPLLGGKGVPRHRDRSVVQHAQVEQ